MEKMSSSSSPSSWKKCVEIWIILNLKLNSIRNANKSVIGVDCFLSVPMVTPLLLHYNTIHSTYMWMKMKTIHTLHLIQRSWFTWCVNNVSSCSQTILHENEILIYQSKTRMNREIITTISPNDRGRAWIFLCEKIYILNSQISGNNDFNENQSTPISIMTLNQ